MKKDLSARGVRFDILAVDQNHNGYDIEVQTSHEYDIGERFRYYYKQANEVVLKTGQKIKQIRQVYIVFISPFDPFDSNRCFYDRYCIYDPDKPPKN